MIQIGEMGAMMLKKASPIYTIQERFPKWALLGVLHGLLPSAKSKSHKNYTKVIMVRLETTTTQDISEEKKGEGYNLSFPPFTRSVSSCIVVICLG